MAPITISAAQDVTSAGNPTNVNEEHNPVGAQFFWCTIAQKPQADEFVNEEHNPVGAQFFWCTIA